jgi:hypothetical protein
MKSSPLRNAFMESWPRTIPIENRTSCSRKSGLAVWLHTATTYETNYFRSGPSLTPFSVLAFPRPRTPALWACGLSTRIPKYEGPPADPKTAAEIDALLADVRGETKRDPPRHISREQALAVFHQRYRPSLVRLFEITDTLPEDFCHLPGDCDFYGSFANSWFVQSALTYDDPCIVADRLVVVSKSSGEIVYDDSANDEG